MTHAEKLARRQPKRDLESQSFKQWFGDSKIVNPDGSPQVWYHGSAQDISTFKPKQAGAIFLTTSPNFAEDFSRLSKDWMKEHVGKGKGAPTLYPMFVRAEKPFDFRNPAHVSAVMDNLRAQWQAAGRNLESPIGKQMVRNIEREIARGDWDAVEMEEVQAAIKAAGHDAFYVMEGGHKNLAVYSPNQVKAAYGNSGAFSTEDDAITAAPARFSVEDETYLQKKERRYVDRFNRVALIQKAVVEQGGTVTDVNNIYKALERMPGRTESRVNDFVDQELKPLIDDAAKAGISLHDVGMYAYLKHARERNAQVAKINPQQPDGGSGLFEADIAQMEQAQQQSGDYAELSALGDRLIALTSGTRDVLENSGLLSPEERAAWEQYKNYVPLRGGDEIDINDIDVPNTGRSIDQRRKLSKRALGRYTAATPEHIFANIIQDRYAAIVRAEKNKVGKALMKFVLDNPDPELWAVDERKMVRSLTKDANGNEVVVERVADIRDPESTVVTKVGGKEYVVHIKDETLAKALLNLDNVKMEEALGLLSKTNRFFARVWTQYNPVFSMTNFLRDLQTGMIHTLADSGFKRAATTAKYIPAAIAQMFRVTRGATTGGHMFAYAREFVENGGKTGYVNMLDLDKQLRHIENLYAQAQGGSWEATKGIGRAFANIVSDVNTAIENGVRIASYRAAREAGESAADAVSAAKNLTVNFNRRGELGANMNALFLFFNPSIQGSARIYRAMKEHPAKMAAITGSMVAAAFAMGMIGALDEDEDGVAYWDKPDVEILKQKNWVFIIPGTKGKRLTIPMPYGYNLFGAAGYALVDLVRGKKSPGRVAAQVVSAALLGYAPIGSGNVDVNSVLPTVVQPFVQLSGNKNAFGNPVYPDYDPNTPDSEKMWPATHGTVAEAITTYLNSVSGGDAHVEGAISISPESLKLVAHFVFGGVGYALEDSFDAVKQVADLGYEDADLSRLPFRRQLFGEHKPEKDSGLYYERLNDLKKVVASYKAAVKAGDSIKVKTLEDRYGQKMISEVGGVISEATKALKDIKKTSAAIRDSDLPPAAKTLKLREQERRRGEVFLEFNRLFTEANDGKISLPTPANVF